MSANATGWTDKIADFVVRTAFAELPPEVVQRAKVPIADTLGTMAAGTADEAGEWAMEYAESLGRPRSRPWIGVDEPLPPDVTAMLSATLAHALDFDDVLPGAGHPSAPVLSAILATAGSAPLSGQRLIEAYVVGIEVMRCISRAVGHLHYKQGWHTTSTIGVFAAAAASAKIRGSDHRQVARALGIAASLAGGLQRNFGTATKPLHSGFAARNGVLAAHLAATGFTASENIFDGPRNFFEVYGAGGHRPEELDRLGAPFALLEPGISLKKYACAFELYRAMDAVLELQEASPVAASELAELRCTVPPGTTGPLINRWPETGMEAKFSLEFGLAVAFVDGGISIGSFDDAAPAREDVRAVASRIVIEEDARVRPEDPEGLNSSASSGGFVEVIMRLTDGSERTAVVNHARGMPARPLTSEEIRSKFLACERVGGRIEQDALDLFERLGSLESEKDVGAMLRHPHV